MHRLHKHSPISRSALADVTGLNKTTVSSLVQELIDYKFVREIGFDTAGTGRPARLLELNPTAGCMISAEITDTGFILVICANFANKVIWRTQEPFNPTANPKIAIHQLLTLLHQTIDATYKRYGPVLGLAIGVPGLVDHKKETLRFAPNLNWENIPLGRLLREEFDRPVFVDNEANLAALGEYYFGAAENCNHLLYISGSIGIGGGIIHNGQVFTGVAGFAGELGHMTIDPQGELCKCGNRGCWETLISQKAILNRLQAVNTGNQPANLPNSVLSLAEAARAGDKIVIKILAEAACYLGIGIASLVNILNPELVVLGGIYCLLGEFLLPTVKQEVNQRALHMSMNANQIVLAKQGSDACVMGGLARVYQVILAQPGTLTG